MAGKDVENQLGAVHDPDGERLFQVPQLGRAEIVIEQDKGGLGRRRNRCDLLHLAFADQRSRIRLRLSLQNFSDYHGPCTGNQFAKFREGGAAVNRRDRTLLICQGIRASQLGGFSRQGGGAWQRRWPGGELDTDEERSFRLDARGFQKILIRAACCKRGTPGATARVPIRCLWVLKEARPMAGTQEGTRFDTGKTLRPVPGAVAIPGTFPDLADRLAFRQGSVGTSGQTARARSACRRMANARARTMIAMQYRPRAYHR
jgi:hypothetical protein